MNAFKYARPETIAEVVALLREHGPEASLLTGGTDLIIRIRKGKTAPRIVIDLKQVKELQSNIIEADSLLRIGALAVIADIVEDHCVQRYFPALTDAASTVGSVQIRNRATLAGNICNASPAADTAPALLVYEARVNIVGPLGKRSVPVSEFFLGPGQTVLQHDELVESIDLPIPRKKTGASFARLTRRRGVDLATLNACCLVKASGTTLFAYGAVGPRPLLFTDDSGILANSNGDRQEKEQVLQRLITSTNPISDVRASREYRLAMLLVISRRALSTALQRLHSSEGGG